MEFDYAAAAVAAVFREIMCALALITNSLIANHVLLL